MDWIKCIASFHAVVNRQSFVKAADMLHTTQSAISKHVSWLERQLGVKLLLRTTRELSLTDQGLIFFQQTQDLLKHWNDVKARTLLQTHELYGQLKIASSSTTGERLVLPLISNFLAQHPLVNIDYQIHNHNLDITRENIDMFVTTLAMPTTKLVVRETLRKLKSHIIAAPVYLDMHGRPKKLQELTKHNCLTYTLYEKPNTWQFSSGKSIELNSNFQTNNLQSIITAAVQGLGIGFIPKEFIGQELAAKRLEILLPSCVAEHYEVYAYYQRAACAFGLVKTCINYFKNNI